MCSASGHTLYCIQGFVKQQEQERYLHIISQSQAILYFQKIPGQGQATDRESVFILTSELSPLSILQYEIWPFETIGAECKFSESSGLVASLLDSGQRKLTFQVELDGGRSPRPPVVLAGPSQRTHNWMAILLRSQDDLMDAEQPQSSHHADYSHS